MIKIEGPSRLVTATKMVRDLISTSFSFVENDRTQKFDAYFDTYEDNDTLLGRTFKLIFTVRYEFAYVWSREFDILDVDDVPCHNYAESEFMMKFQSFADELAEELEGFLTGEKLQRKRIDTSVKTLKHYARRKREELFDCGDIFHDKIKAEAITLENAAEIMSRIDKVL